MLSNILLSGVCMYHTVCIMFLHSLSRSLTEKPHIAGSEVNHQLAVMIYDQWSKFHFDKVELVNYSVLLSYPNMSNTNVLQLKNGSGDVLYTGHSHQEPPLTPGEDNPNVAPPFNAYSGSGEAKVQYILEFTP